MLKYPSLSSEFQARVARKVASGSMETSSDDSQLEAERTTLGELKGRGKKQSVPSVRTAKGTYYIACRTMSNVM